MAEITSVNGGPHRYRCDAGHEISIADGTYTMLTVQYDGSPPGNYNYCMHCFGAWAVTQFPLPLRDVAPKI